MTDEQILKAMGEMMAPIKRQLDELSTETRQTRILVERQGHDISVIAEQYGDISRKLDRLHEIDDLRDRVRTLERAVSAHSDQIKEMKKAQ